jgi:hypothetical protein
MLMLIFAQLSAQTGKISGKVTDAKSGETLIGVAVYLEGTTIGASTDLDGKFLLNNLKPGAYSVVARYVSYKIKTVTGVEVKAGETIFLEISSH